MVINMNKCDPSCSSANYQVLPHKIAFKLNQKAAKPEPKIKAPKAPATNAVLEEIDRIARNAVLVERDQNQILPPAPPAPPKPVKPVKPLKNVSTTSSNFWTPCKKAFFLAVLITHNEAAIFQGKIICPNGTQPTTWQGPAGIMNSCFRQNRANKYYSAQFTEMRSLVSIDKIFKKVTLATITSKSNQDDFNTIQSLNGEEKPLFTRIYEVVLENLPE